MRETKIPLIVGMKLLFIFQPILNADLRVEKWHQKNTINNSGQEIDVILELQAESLKPNYYHDYWSISFDRDSRVSVLEAKVFGDKNFSTGFGNNVLNFKFRKLTNSQRIKIKFKYQIDNDDNTRTPYLRREAVQIPEFAQGAEANLEVLVPDSMTLFSLNHLFYRAGNLFSWSGVVAKDGFRDIFAMTRERARWRVTTTLELKDPKGIGNLFLRLPIYYVGGNNVVEKYNASTSQMGYIDDNYIRKTKNSLEIKFNNSREKESFVLLEAIVTNTYGEFHWSNDFDFRSTTKVDENYSVIFNDAIGEINSNDSTDLPLYIKIARWIHDNMIYDINLVGKRMTSLEIFKGRKGVCEHYAILYQDMLRSINIPAQIIGGLGYNFDKKHFEDHAWVMVYHNSSWIPVDPTWGIYSGKLPISHIFLQNNITDNISFRRAGSLDTLKVEVKRAAEFIE
jgi:hypothetical protein